MDFRKIKRRTLVFLEISGKSNHKEINKDIINKKDNKTIMAEASNTLKRPSKNLTILDRLEEKINLNKIKTFKIIL